MKPRRENFAITDRARGYDDARRRHGHSGRRWSRAALVAGVAAIVSLAPIVVSAGTSSASSDETDFLVFGPPAVGSNGSYSVSTTFGTAFGLPGISAGSQTPSATYTIGANTAGCTVGANGAGFSYTKVGSCSINVVATGDPDDSSNGGNSDGHEGPGNDPDTASATLTVTVNPGKQTISLTSESGSVGATLPLVATGYIGSGTITFAIVGGTAPGCALSGASAVKSSGAGTCLVTATIAADANFASATSSPATMSFSSSPRRSRSWPRAERSVFRWR